MNGPLSPPANSEGGGLKSPADHAAGHSTGRRLMLAVPSLQFGGAERVVANMANHWAARGETVSVVTLSREEGDTYSVDERVTRIALNAMKVSRGPLQAITHNIVRVRLLRAAIAERAPDTLISFTDRMNVLALLAARPLGIDTIISERIDPSRHRIGRTWSWLRRRVYPSARALVVQTKAVREQMAPLMRGRPIYVIPNAVAAPPAAAPLAAHAGDGKRWILGVGRLERQKGFDLLIEAFSRLAERYPQWSLRILGEGSERRALEQLIDAKRLAGRVVLAGWQADPVAVMRECELFVLSSRFEGFPNALLEAMACGLPVVSFDCPSGPREIIRDEVDGLLVPPEDVSALASRIEQALSDEPLRRRLGTEALRVVERFGVEPYFTRWEAVLRGDAEPSSI